MDSKRSYGMVLIGKTKPEDRALSPCMRYFIDADGNRITEPEEFVPPENTGWLPEENIETEEKEMTPKAIKKPTAEELRADQLIMNKLQAMKKYNCAKATIERWTRELELPHWKQSRERGTEKQNEAVLPLGGSSAMDSIPGDSPNDSEPNMEQEERQERMQTIPAEPEVLEELSTLDDIPFAKELTTEEEAPKSDWDYSQNHTQKAREFLDKYKGMELGGHISVLDDPDEPDWQHIENEIKTLYSLKLNRLNGEFKGRLRKILEGVGI